MKKVSCTAVFLFLLLASGPAVLSAEDFYGARWGMKMSEVEVEVDGELTFYDGEGFTVLGTDIVTVYGRDCIVIYYFSHLGNLVKGGYYFRPGYPDGMMFKSDYDRLTDIMMENYGESRERLMWHTNWHYEPREYLKAVKNGDLTMMSFWESEDSFIELSLAGDRAGYNLALQFYSKNLYEEYVDMLLERAIAEDDAVVPEDLEDLGSGLE